MPFKNYFSLFKPGIILGNLLATAGGYFLGSKGNLDVKTFIGSMLGMFFVIAAAALSNNIIDQDIDQLMKRTQKRWISMRSLTFSKAILLSIVFLIAGISILVLMTNYLTLIFTIAGFIIYLLVYTYGLKRHSLYSTMVGGISGAMPPIAGYCASTHQIDITVWLLLGSFVFWQIPHAHAVGVFYREDFNKARLPLIPVIKSSIYTKNSMLLWSLLYWIILGAYYYFQIKGRIFLIINSLVTVIWIMIILSGHFIKNEKKWARLVFIHSLLVIGTLSLLLTGLTK